VTQCETCEDLPCDAMKFTCLGEIADLTRIAVMPPAVSVKRVEGVGFALHGV